MVSAGSRAGNALPRSLTSASCTTMAKAFRQDYKEAIKWYRLAAEQGDALARHNLGVMFDDGDGVPQNKGDR